MQEKTEDKGEQGGLGRNKETTPYRNKNSQGDEIPTEPGKPGAIGIGGDDSHLHGAECDIGEFVNLPAEDAKSMATNSSVGFEFGSTGVSRYLALKNKEVSMMNEEYNRIRKEQEEANMLGVGGLSKKEQR